MKPTLSIIFMLALSCISFHKGENVQKDELLCEAFLLGSEQVKLFNEPNGKEVGIIQNNDLEEDFYNINIYAQKEKWFKVQAKSIKSTLSGWLLSKSYLGTYSRNYTDTLFVYEQPNDNKLICSFTEYFISPMKVLECKKDWVKVEIETKNLSCTGWVSKNMTCPSPYTTCN